MDSYMNPVKTTDWYTLHRHCPLLRETNCFRTREEALTGACGPAWNSFPVGRKGLFYQGLLTHQLWTEHGRQALFADLV